MSGPPFWAAPLALIFSTFGTILGLYAFISPRSAAAQHGFDVSQSADVDFIYVFGGRNIATGLMIHIFCWQKQYQAAGTVLLCIMFSGVVDAVLAARSEHATAGAAWVHALGTAGLGLAGWGLLRG